MRRSLVAYAAFFAISAGSTIALADDGGADGAIEAAEAGAPGDAATPIDATTPDDATSGDATLTATPPDDLVNSHNGGCTFAPAAHTDARGAALALAVGAVLLRRRKRRS